MNYYMGVDVGSSSSKGVLIDRNAEICAEYSCLHDMENPKPGYFEHDAEKVWWGDFCEISRKLLSESKVDPRDIKGVGVSALGADCVPVDEQCRPLRKAILYGIDARAEEELKEIENYIGADRIKEMRGNPLCSEDVFAKSLWIKNKEPEIYEKTYKFCTGSTYLTAKLTGIYVLDDYLAQLCYFPAYRTDGTLAEEMVAPFIDPSMMPYTAKCTDIVGKVTKEAAGQTGLAEGTPVITGTDDAGAEAISAGIVQRGDTMIMLGSSMYMISLSDHPIADARLWNCPYLIPGIPSIQGATNNMGTVTKWLKEKLFPELEEAEKEGGENAYAAMVKLGESVPPGSEGLMALPYFSGERTPINDPYASGVLFGLRLHHDRRHIYRAFLEGIACGIAQNISVLEENRVAIRQLIATGGGTKNPLLLQILADVLGREIFVPEVTIGASYGDAVLSMIGCGELSSFEEAKKLFRYDVSYKPDETKYRFYREQLERFDKLYRSTKNINI